MLVRRVAELGGAEVEGLETSLRVIILGDACITFSQIHKTSNSLRNYRTPGGGCHQMDQLEVRVKVKSKRRQRQLERYRRRRHITRIM